MRKNFDKISLVFIVLFTVSLAYAASDVQISQGTEIELVDVNNSSIYMGQDYNFTNVTVYGSDVEFKNNSVTNNLTVYPNNSQEINSTLKQYKLNNPSDGTVFEIETEAISPVEVTYEVDANNSGGTYEVFDNNSNSKGTFDGSSTITWSETSWSNNTFTIEYSESQTKVELNWTDNSDNEDQFNVYSNSSGQSLANSDIYSRSPEVTENSVSGTGSYVQTNHSSSLDSGEYVCYKVTSENQYGESDPTSKACVSIS